jgi:hypothetical protein
MLTLRSAALTVAILFDGPALAEQGTATDHREDAAWRQLDKAMAANFDEEQRGKLVWIGYNVAATALCDDLSLDISKMRASMEALQPADAGMEEEKKQYLHNALLVNLGMAVGIFMAEHADAQDSFCAEATALRDDPEDTTNLFSDPEAEAEDAPPPAE